MIVYRTERAYATISRRLLKPILYETTAPTTFIRAIVNNARRERAKCVREQRRPLTTTTRRFNEIQSERAPFVEPFFPNADAAVSPNADRPATEQAQLPQTCPGCGALTQESEVHSPGFYSRSRKAVKIYLRRQKQKIAALNAQVDPDTEGELADTAQEVIIHDNEITDTSSKETVDDKIQDMNVGMKANSEPSVPFCDRCHDLIHDSKGQSIAHPSIDNIADSIAESPFKRNHIYHVVDAADFPLSVVPSIFTKLVLAKSRSQNRRSQHDFSSKPTVSFIITRSDLLGSTKEIVDSMMPYFQSVLRKALGTVGKDMRLGNVHLVSAKRGWWTKEIKEDIWKRGGGNWLVGKVNVGKSNLFEVLFPKASGERAPVYSHLERRQSQSGVDSQSMDNKTEYLLDENSLLPPAQPERAFPVFPIVSSLPGTTASPIRLPFGNHKGELIDLPGLDRGDLEKYVTPDKRLDIVMTHRHKVEQYILKPGQSLILGGGLIRITPQLDMADRSTTLLAYPFVPLKAHVTSTEKATLQQTQQRESGIDSILAANVGTHMSSAGIIELNTDVTKSRAGALLRSGVELSKLPFRVYATDILVEGLGWIELVCQVRQRPTSQPNARVMAYNETVSGEAAAAASESDQSIQVEREFAPFGLPVEHATKENLFPNVEVFSPNGRHVSSRPSLEAWRRWTDGRKRKTTPNNDKVKKYMARSRSNRG